MTVIGRARRWPVGLMALVAVSMLGPGTGLGQSPPAAEPGPARPPAAEPGPAQPPAAEPGPAQPPAAEPGPAQPPAAEPGPAQPPAAQARASYELQHILFALRRTGLRFEASPDGKTIAFVRVYRYPVFIPQEPFPTVFNAIHFTTTEDTILKEVLLGPGDPWDRQRAEETARNLREMSIFSIAGLVPVKGEGPGEIGLLVVTRDLWSLRLETDFQLTGDYVDRLVMQITERNLLGRDKRATIRFNLEPLDYSVGAIYVDPRLGGGDLRLVGTFDTRFERASGAYDGLKGYLELARPFYDLRQRWGFGVVGQYEQYTARVAQRGTLLQYPVSACQTIEPDGRLCRRFDLGRTWDHRLLGVAALGRVQLGRRWITRLAAGVGFLRIEADPNAGSRLPPGDAPDAVAARAAFEDDVLPSERRWLYPTANVRLFENRHRVWRELAGFGLSEDVRLGPSVFVDGRLPTKALGSNEDLLDLGANLKWAESWADDGLIEVGLGVRARLQIGEDAWVDQRYLARIRGATPILGVGRIVARADWVGQRAQLTPDLVTLGGDNGLRGYASQAFFAFGADRVRGNIEFRTVPWVYSFLHLGAAAFFDAGSIYTDPDEMSLRTSAGIGLRMVVPQASPFAYRLDLGVPTDGTGFFINVGFETAQAVPLTPIEDAQYDFSVGGLVNQP